MKGVSKSFKLPGANPFKRRGTARALDSVDFALTKSRITCILGPNGAGKTTLIKILASLIMPDSGEMLFEGEPYWPTRNSVNSRIGLVTPNERAFYWRLSGWENLRFFGSLHGFRGSALNRRVAEVLEETGMTESAEKPYRLYSAGMKQKLNIARALLGNPDVYLLDEPADHLDPIARGEFHAFVRSVLVGKREATILLCTHDLDEAYSLSDEIVILDSGRVVARGGTRELLESVEPRREPGCPDPDRPAGPRTSGEALLALIKRADGDHA